MAFLLCALGVVLVGIDQLTKHLATTFLKGNEAIALIPGVFELQYATNKGAAFGILKNFRWVFMVFTVLIIGVMLYVLLCGHFKRYRWIQFSAVLVIAGGIGNLIDRILFGYVVDFLYVKAINFPIFNFADCCIVVGSIILLICFLFFYKPEADKRGEDGLNHGDQNVDTDSLSGGGEN